MPFPDPTTRHPLILPDGTALPSTVFLAAVLDTPQFEAGDYTYASARVAPGDWAERLAPYLRPGGEALRIGKFCQIADSVLFITTSANHRYDGFSTYPFAIFDGMDPTRPSLPEPPYADTVIGNDVWFGQGARILPGSRIGSGCIIGAGAVVGGEIPPYCVVAGNPGQILRRRFDPAVIDRLLEIAWWDWPIEIILGHEAAICGGDIDALETAAKTL